MLVECTEPTGRFLKFIRCVAPKPYFDKPVKTLGPLNGRHVVSVSCCYYDDPRRLDGVYQFGDVQAHLHIYAFLFVATLEG